MHPLIVALGLGLVWLLARGPRRPPEGETARIPVASFSSDLLKAPPAEPDDYWQGWSEPAAKRLGIKEAWRWED